MTDKRLVFVILGLLCVFAQAELVEEEISDQQDVSIEESSDEVADSDRFIRWIGLFRPSPSPTPRPTPRPRPIPQDCRLSGWSEWSACSKPCGGGTMTKTRTVVAQPQNGGRKCGSLTWTTWCNSHQCPIDCKFTEWNRWTTCQTCGIQTRSRRRIPAQYGGKLCPNEPLDEFRLCPTTHCNECVYGPEKKIPGDHVYIGRQLSDTYEALLVFSPPHVKCEPRKLSYRAVSGGMGDTQVAVAVQAIMAPVPEPSPFAESVF
eukprot:TRINITY_DN5858_c0_g3_i2.p1 TRINITY_DN5858_c0_g3~~TRINITY_DN5858_c0_g3_i2.p1  ORF type:complete len:261 (+),score=42.68 TRINITY_DN5858_c0_g3_i2:64-846(+)